MRSYIQEVLETVRFLKSRALKSGIQNLPKIGILTGTGLGDAAESFAPELSLDYAEIPEFPRSTVVGHAGRLLFGSLADRPLIAMQGRFHLYEGYSPGEVTFPIRVMQELGVEVLILSNAAGGINPDFTPGRIMIISDHLNLTGENPLVGANEDRWGPRFPEMGAAYNRKLSVLAKRAAESIGIRLGEGVYAGLKGPSLETPAEVRYLKTIGADAVGFSTVLESIAAVHAGMKVLGVSVITNVHDPDRPVSADLESILCVANEAAPKLGAILAGVVKEL
jgi:purine-nucleoside phosphorylase